MPARRGGARRNLLSDRPGDDGQRARLRPADGQLARQRRRPRLRARGARAPRRSPRPISRASPKRSCCGRRRSSASCGSPTPSRPDRRSCRRSAIPMRPSSCAARPAASSGALIGLLIVMKGLPLAYSKDMQEDKEGLFDALETLSLCARRDDRHGRGPDARSEADEGGGGRGLRHRDRSRRLARPGAQSPVPRGPPRDRAHRRARRRARRRRSRSSRSTRCRSVEPRITEDAFGVLGVERSVKSRTSYGGTAPANVRRQAKAWLKRLGEPKAR